MKLPPLPEENTVGLLRNALQAIQLVLDLHQHQETIITSRPMLQRLYALVAEALRRIETL